MVVISLKKGQYCFRKADKGDKETSTTTTDYFHQSSLSSLGEPLRMAMKSTNRRKI
jgi:hypothetical protein